MYAQSGNVQCKNCEIVGFGMSSSIGMGGARLFDGGHVTPRCVHCGHPLSPISYAEFEFSKFRKEGNIVKFILRDPLDWCYEGFEAKNEKVLASWGVV
jgi:hypothetical protein